MGLDRPAPIRVAGGVVAYNDAPRLEAAVRSLIEPPLPAGAVWSDVWLVVSPSPDGTVGVAKELARSDPRIRVLVEPRRRGKSAALREILLRAQGDVLVVLNGDARADPLAVTHLLGSVSRIRGPYAVMARPVPEPLTPGLFHRALSLLWGVHDDFHHETIDKGAGSHLSDELLLLSTNPPLSMEEGIINDGAFLGEQIVARGGWLGYAPQATVWISTPRSLREHLVQRRRIHLGHRQLSRMTRAPPTTLLHWGARHPKEALILLWRRVRQEPHGRSAFLVLVGTELLAAAIAGWATLRGDSPPVLWERASPTLGPAVRPAEEPIAG